jgi:hypothetical protein
MCRACAVSVRWTDHLRARDVFVQVARNESVPIEQSASAIDLQASASPARSVCTRRAPLVSVCGLITMRVPFAVPWQAELLIREAEVLQKEQAEKSTPMLPAREGPMPPGAYRASVTLVECLPYRTGTCIV